MIRLRGRKNEASKVENPAVSANGTASRVLSQTVSKRHFLKTLLTGAGLAAVAEMGQIALAPRTAEATLSDPQGILIGNRPYGPGINLSYDGTNDRAYTDVYNDAAVAYKPWRINASNLIINNASAGRVGIGTSNPATILTIHENTLGTAALRLRNDNLPSGGFLALECHGWDDGALLRKAFDLRFEPTANGWTNTWGIGHTGSLYFDVNQSPGGSANRSSIVFRGFEDGAAMTEWMRIKGGNVGIAQSNPQALLHLGNGAIKIVNTLIADSGGCYYAQ